MTSYNMNIIQIKVKRKTLHFHENHRPAYFGSWRKKSTIVRPRRPFGQDKSLLEYDYDSDEDWEEVWGFRNSLIKIVIVCLEIHLVTNLMTFF